ncbi:DciA family protein [Aquimonas sp.]|jgi:hypothetical protein|uniref:DciA family protein n=1 Tax=Aquimonas sp. TaxID=1872588 RepID=UPI0037BFE6A4
MQTFQKSTFQSLLTAKAGSTLDGVIERARALDTLDRRLRQSLPEPAASQCRLANVRDGRLVFLVTSPIWKSKLRLYADVLLTAAAEAGIQARELTVKVAPMLTVPPEQASHSPLSPAAAAALREAAIQATDPELRQQLLALASMADPTS